MEKTEVDGQTRWVHRRVRYPSPPLIGTLVGPNDAGEHFVVVGQDGDVTLLSYATNPDFVAARAYIIEQGPRSVAERSMAAVMQRIDVVEEPV
jgi:hypothetical protein